MHTLLIPTLTVKNGANAVNFYKQAFAAEEQSRHTSDNGDIVAELTIDQARFYVADEAPDLGNLSPHTLGGISVRLGLQVDDPDALAKQALDAGARLLYAVADQDYGYRVGRIVDPFGHHWEIFRPL